MNLILFGLKGSGKTYLGEKLALKIRRPFIDLDLLLQEAYEISKGGKKSVSEVYRDLGEERFRMLEKETLFSLKESQNCVISLGGGTLLNPENVTFCQTLGTLVYLKADLELLKNRVLKGEIPAFLEKENPSHSFLEMAEKREKIYESIEAKKVDLKVLDEEEALEVLSLVAN